MLARLRAAIRGPAKPVETRSAPSSWDLLRLGAFGESDAGVTVTPYAAESLAAVAGCVSAISESVASLSLNIFRRLPDGGREESPSHPVARLFREAPNAFQTPVEFLESQTALCALRGNSFAEIVRDGRGSPSALLPLHPDCVSVVRLPSGALAYEVSDHGGARRRLLADEVLHLRDRSDDGLIGRSRLSRAAAAFAGALAAERFANATFKNGAAMSGVLQHPGELGEEAAERLRKSFKDTYSGSDRAGSVAILEEGLKWTQVSVSPDDAQALESRRFSVEQICRIFRVPPPIIGHMEGSNYSSVSELGRWFISYSIVPWLRRWESTIERCLFSEEGRRLYECEFDADELLRGDMLTRFQAYRIAREVGVYNANELRRFEKANPRRDTDGEAYFSPRQMQPEQTGQSVADRGGGADAAT